MEQHSIKLWLGEIDQDQADYSFHHSILDESERERASRFKIEQLRWYYVATHSLLRRLLAKMVNTSPAKLRIMASRHGKPYLADYPEIEFNLSHTGNQVAIAIAFGMDIGIDIEQCKPRANFAALVEKCFGDEEKRYWRQLPEPLKMPEFYRFWTCKEAFVKATGAGIAVGLKQCVINPSYPGRMIEVPEGFGTVGDWQIHDLDIERSAAIAGALAVKSRALVSVIRLQVEPDFQDTLAGGSDLPESIAP